MSNEEWVEVRIKLGANEIEVKGKLSNVKTLLDVILPLIKERESKSLPEIPQKEESEEVSVLPVIKVSEKESVSEILLKLFNTNWARSPRSLSEVVEALENLGLYYPKATIAVNLKRLVQRGKLRRIKDKDGTFRYVPVIPPRGETIEG